MKSVYFSQTIVFTIPYRTPLPIAPNSRSVPLTGSGDLARWGDYDVMWGEFPGSMEVPRCMNHVKSLGKSWPGPVAQPEPRAVVWKYLYMITVLIYGDFPGDLRIYPQKIHNISEYIPNIDCLGFFRSITGLSFQLGSSFHPAWWILIYIYIFFFFF